MRSSLRAAVLSGCTSLLVAAAFAADGQQARDGRFPLRVLSQQIVGDSTTFGEIMAGDAAPDGSVYVADFMNARVLRFSPAGSLMWRAGRRGRGPAEFQTVYRVAAISEGGVLVYDRGTHEISELRADGTYAGRRSLAFPLSQVDNLVSLPGGRIAVSGVVSSRVTDRGATTARNFGVHIFEPNQRVYRHVRSFGPLPAAEDRAVLDLWGAGGISLANNGDLLYSRRLPFEIYRYSVQGQLKGKSSIPLKTDKGPDDAFRIERTSGSTRTSFSDTDVVRPLTAFDLRGGWILTGRRQRDELYWDLLSPGGAVVSQRLPLQWRGVLAVDNERQVIWMKGARDSYPVLIRLSTALAGSRSNSPSPRRRP